MEFVSPLSCSVTSRKSGLWCDANLSCLRISTPQKPWSPTAELKTCWLLTMDSRTLFLPASGLAAPSSIHRYRHLFCPGVSYTSHAGPSIRVSDYEFTHNPRVLHSWNLLRSYFCFLRCFTLFCECIPTPFSVFFPFLPCHFCQCGIWEHGLLNTGSFIPSWNCVLNWLDNVGNAWHCLGLICWHLFGFFSVKGNKSWTSCSDERMFLSLVFFFLFCSI